MTENQELAVLRRTVGVLHEEAIAKDAKVERIGKALGSSIALNFLCCWGLIILGGVTLWALGG